MLIKCYEVRGQRLGKAGILNGVAKEDLSEEVPLEQRPEWNEEAR